MSVRHCSMSSLVPHMRLAAAAGSYDGRNTPWARAYIARCTWQHGPTQANLIFTRDIGMHTSGWWKNPDYERCFHLSVSFVGLEAGREFPLPQNHKSARRWCEAMFGSNVKLLWIEPPFTDRGKTRDVWHYRLFCDAAWLPVKPRGEVYSRDWTPADWKSWSDVHGVENGDGSFGQLIGGLR